MQKGLRSRRPFLRERCSSSNILEAAIAHVVADIAELGFLDHAAAVVIIGVEHTGIVLIFAERLVAIGIPGAEGAFILALAFAPARTKLILTQGPVGVAVPVGHP